MGETLFTDEFFFFSKYRIPFDGAHDFPFTLRPFFRYFLQIPTQSNGNDNKRSTRKPTEPNPGTPERAEKNPTPKKKLEDDEEEEEPSLKTRYNAAKSRKGRLEINNEVEAKVEATGNEGRQLRRQTTRCGLGRKQINKTELGKMKKTKTKKNWKTRFWNEGGRKPMMDGARSLQPSACPTLRPAGERERPWHFFFNFSVLFLLFFQFFFGPDRPFHRPNIAEQHWVILERLYHFYCILCHFFCNFFFCYFSIVLLGSWPVLLTWPSRVRHGPGAKAPRGVRRR